VTRHLGVKSNAQAQAPRRCHGRKTCGPTVKLTKRDRAIKLRDKALKLVRSKGKLSPMLTGKTVLVKTLTYHSGDLQIEFRLPHEPIPRGSENPAYGLDVYWSKKVLCVEWDDAGSVRVIGFRPGEWEARLAALAATVSAVD